MSELDLSQLGNELYGFLITKELWAASGLLIIYDYLLCLDQEVEYFWDSKANRLTRTLYFLNRLFPPVSYAFRGISLFETSLSAPFCNLWIRFDYAFTILALYFAEAVLVARVYHLYSHNRPLQMLILFVCLGGNLAALVLVIVKITRVEVIGVFPKPIGEVTAACLPALPNEFWSVFVPIIFTETLLFACTVLRIFSVAHKLQKKTRIIKSLLLDGTMFYLCALVTVVMAIAGSIVITAPQFAIPAILSNIMVAFLSICASRLLINIRTLAARLDCDPDLILNDLQLTRIYGKGAGTLRRDGSKVDVYVDVVANEDDDNESNGHLRLKTDTVGHGEWSPADTTTPWRTWR